jgi:hypothetical protein
MAMSIQATNSTIQRFNAIQWHDSKLLGLAFYRAGSEEQLKISLQLLGPGGNLIPTDLMLIESTYIALEVDLEGKRVCSDDIAGAVCYASSEWIRALSERNPHDSFEGYLHFKINLIPPGGNINILAKDFILSPLE